MTSEPSKIEIYLNSNSFGDTPETNHGAYLDAVIAEVRLVYPGADVSGFLGEHIASGVKIYPREIEDSKTVEDVNWLMQRVWDRDEWMSASNA